MAAALTKVTDDPLKVRIYHITHCDNIESIVNRDGILPINLLAKHKVECRSIADRRIQKRRDTVSIDIPPYGNLHDYVPWSFAARSPMLCAVWKKGEVGGETQQDDIVHLVTNVDWVQQHKLQSVFTNGHPIVDLSKFPNGLKFSNDLTQLPATLDWDILLANQWKTSDDPDRQRRRQAEFLTHGIVPWSMIRWIGVHNINVHKWLSRLLQGQAHQPQICVLREWYY